MYPTGPAAYDRAITVFSPDGRLFQVEYAREAVKRGTTACGIAYENGVLLAVDKSITSSLIIPQSIEKIFKIDEHIGIATSGLVADARRLIEEARIMAQRSRVAYNEPISVVNLTREICDIKQLYTQYGGARPFGAALLIAGVNDKPYLFETDPSGAFTQYLATSIGVGKSDVDKLFEREYRKGMSRYEAIALALKALNLISEKKLSREFIEIITIELGDRYREVSKKEIGDVMQSLKNELNKREGS
ncbi:MAG: proteasome endopeptidase complex, archaeal, alpha subunit [Candidatus Altiarchaeales archaeon]|nr:MAG: proteasome endopeptidase complex, archaeal, alpha subunit [Candidatus Altiarchaeales archaeon]RLI94419.1 MAG: proteasome endopeptidase complex, archaeal, alpha subunit [Candidatus Altiarchaeales archaeon]RLI94503.1 MAG: proteasome endopeptidase complex, archaeal, alpha subunit [Candidatus Altiarchaeales archaeon]HDO82626.1 archaeal proteasome endopeptidase complex subunit alpha [Candidatus Altiarchaeales archaeon]HEX55275.1 archaeal proteasome endopeptidase complex subunit alpha [Candid